MSSSSKFPFRVVKIQRPSYKKVKKNVNRIISTNSKLIRGGEAKEAQFSNREQLKKFYDKLVTTKGINRLSFAIVVKGGEDLGVSINAKGGDCW